MKEVIKISFPLLSPFRVIPNGSLATHPISSASPPYHTYVDSHSTLAVFHFEQGYVCSQSSLKLHELVTNIRVEKGNKQEHKIIISLHDHPHLPDFASVQQIKSVLLNEV